MACLLADRQNAENILKTIEILAMWELINEPENHFINAKKQRRKNNNNSKYTKNDTILKRRDNCHFSIVWKETSACAGKSTQNTLFAYRAENERSTSGRGARASYRTMFPEISARWSLLDPSFGYPSPGREGEKCRPLDHMWQIPFVHSGQFVITSYLYIYVKAHQQFHPCGRQRCVLVQYAYNKCARAISETRSSKFTTIIQVINFHTEYWQLFAWSFP